MKRLITTMGFAAAMIAASPVPADEVAESQINSFSSGTTASAAEVNGNFSALVNAINDNARRIGALESLSAPSVSGSQYELRAIGMLFRGNNDPQNGYATMGNYSQVYTLVFDSTNGFTLTGHENEGEVGTPGGQTTRIQNNAPNSMSGSWSQTGNQVTLNTPDASFNVVVTSDGSVLLSNDFVYAVDGSFTSSESSMTVGVRQD